MSICSEASLSCLYMYVTSLVKLCTPNCNLLISPITQALYTKQIEKYIALKLK